ncbi:hypothetical protein SK571_04035 [Lentzea sp. BCCO 10_0798]|uniref:Uncharacterized protein n=1 Tax=Lentzea kristufekii TaxID=3095430 RepID=A0ABU4TKE0_9PSEU|nr:hypothetical protein [Lentzea sp. BCCO 10_0798]MDX8048539.1 hypothetical protein [Lentzea sp. BCCO 10_0798]
MSVKTGQAQYPWISSIGFRPKQSFLNGCELLITTQQEIEEDVNHFNRLTVLLTAGADSGELSRQVVQRLAQHHLLDRDGLPDSAVSEFEALCEATRLSNPEKGSHSVYYLPAFKSYPYGVGYSNGQLENSWLGPGLGTT